MPRIDNSLSEVQERYKYDFNEANPGDTSPIDVCKGCYYQLWKELDKIDHSPYEDAFLYRPYYCSECRYMLGKRDN